MMWTAAAGQATLFKCIQNRLFKEAHNFLVSLFLYLMLKSKIFYILLSLHFKLLLNP